MSGIQIGRKVHKIWILENKACKLTTVESLIEPCSHKIYWKPTTKSLAQGNPVEHGYFLLSRPSRPVFFSSFELVTNGTAVSLRQNHHKWSAMKFKTSLLSKLHSNKLYAYLDEKLLRVIGVSELVPVKRIQNIYRCVFISCELPSARTLPIKTKT